VENEVGGADLAVIAGGGEVVAETAREGLREERGGVCDR
jgi:hypothetical protein